MKRISFLPVLFMCAISMHSSGQQAADNSFTASNPFYEASKLPYYAADFSRIKNADFKPALEAGMQQQLAEIQKIADNPEKPTFENTFVAMEKSGQLLRRVNDVFNLLTGANTNPDLQKLQEEEAPKLAANDDAIYLNARLFKRVEAVYNEREHLKLDAESKRLVEYYYLKFELAGAKLSETDKPSLNS